MLHRCLLFSVLTNVFVGVTILSSRLVADDSQLIKDPIDSLAAIATALGSPVQIAAVIEQGDGGTQAAGKVLAVTATLEEGWHLYSLNQGPGGPRPTQIVVAADSPLKPTAAFVSQKMPTKRTVEDVPSWKGLVVEEHAGTVTWRAPLVENPSGTATAVHGSVSLQLCRDNACTPPETIAFTVDATTPSLPQSNTPFTHTPERGHLQIDATLGAPQLTVLGHHLWPLRVKLLPQSGWHLYAPSASDSSQIGQGKPTIVSLVAGHSLQATSLTVAKTKPPASTVLAQSSAVEGPLVFEIMLEEIEASSQAISQLDQHSPASPSSKPPASVDIIIGFQTCTETTCDPPWAVRLTTTLAKSGAPPSGRITFTEDRYAEAAKAPAPIAQLKTAQPSNTVEAPTPTSSAVTGTGSNHLDQKAAPISLPIVMMMGIAGGLILNLMPCVLPVLGLKLMSFAQQSGRRRQEIFALNLWYCAGLYAVFFALATASVAANIGLGSENLAWGEQFTSSRFNIVMAGIVFAFALSFLGVWELPIPGFIGETAGRVESQEGPLGSFLKGALSTVLATPCSGPFLGPVFGFTLGQSTGVTYAVFAAIATGMALPYIIVGMLPGLVKFLPKPGAWMETLKEVLGFVMLGTVVFLFTFLNRDFFVPTFALLIGIWAACWWVGRSQVARGGDVGLGRWIQAGAIVATVGSLAFAFLGPVTSIIPWQTYSSTRLRELRTGGATVMVDFSADWCATCKLNLATAIETNRVKAAVEANGVVPLLADWTEGSAEIKAMLESLQSKSIPVLAFFPAMMPEEKPRDPIVLRDLITESQVLEAIRQAGPSHTIGPEVRAATAARGTE